jgi:hypothetical protein
MPVNGYTTAILLSLTSGHVAYHPCLRMTVGDGLRDIRGTYYLNEGCQLLTRSRVLDNMYHVEQTFTYVLGIRKTRRQACSSVPPVAVWSIPRRLFICLVNAGPYCCTSTIQTICARPNRSTDQPKKQRPVALIFLVRPPYLAAVVRNAPIPGGRARRACNATVVHWTYTPYTSITTGLHNNLTVAIRGDAYIANVTPRLLPLDRRPLPLAPFVCRLATSITTVAPPPMPTG